MKSILDRNVYPLPKVSKTKGKGRRLSIMAAYRWFDQYDEEENFQGETRARQPKRNIPVSNSFKG